MPIVKNALSEIEDKDNNFNNDLEKFLEEQCGLGGLFEDFFQKTPPTEKAEVDKEGNNGENNEKNQEEDKDEKECPSFNQNLPLIFFCPYF